MILRQRLSWPTFTLALLYCFTSFLPYSHAKDSKPKIASSEFDVPLQPIYWFDDSDNLIAFDRNDRNVYVSKDAGANWSLVSSEGQENKAFSMWPHPHDKRKAYIVGTDGDHWVTSDRGLTWRKFTIESGLNRFHDAFAFHARDSKKVIFHGIRCESIFLCEEVTFWTDDDFENVHPLRERSSGCYWAVGTPEFGLGTSEEEDMEDRIFCVVEGLYSQRPTDYQLRYSDDHFKTEKEPRLNRDKTVNGIIDLAAVKKYLVTAAKSEGSYELGLYVTDDATTWHRAEFGDHKLEQDAYTILESTNYSIQVDVMTQKKTAMGAIYASNSNGTYFTRNIEHTNRDASGRVDFEKVEGIQGIYLANIVDNWEDVETKFDGKRVRSQITFDDGRTFHGIKAGDKDLHLHSVTDMHNIGRVFSSPAPGIVMGIGNTGKQLTSWEEGDLYVSDDAGVTWRQALEGAHHHEIGNNGAVLVAVDGEEPTDEIRYSTTHGKGKWETAKLPMEGLKAALLTTVPDSTSLKFLLAGVTGRGQSARWHFISIDFGGLHERECTDKDFEDWPARVDDDGNPSCLMGHEQYYRRRKADAECVIKEEFKDPVPTYKKCKCSEEDFECDYNFIKDADKCKPTRALESPEGTCNDPDDTFKGSSGFRLIPGNECERDGGVELDKEVDRPCTDTKHSQVAEGISSKKNHFNAKHFSEFYYLERTEQSHDEDDDETIVMRIDSQEVHMTKDHGKNWQHILKGEPIEGIKPHEYFNDIVYFITGGKKVFYSVDRGDNIRSFETNDPPTEDRNRGLPVLSFHEKYADWLLWTGARECPGERCHNVVTYSTDRGDEWKTLLRYSRKCEFIKPEGRKDREKLVYCEQYGKENMDNPLQLFSSDNWFADSEKHFDDIIGFATMSEFIVVAAQDEEQRSLRADASVDGKTFADAEFPKNFHVSHQSAYTVLDSSTHAVFLHVTVNGLEDHEHGAILKSNSNGTSYVMSLDAVNRDTGGFVDFEKMKGLEGVALVNIVDNRKASDETGEKKKLKTMITHNDGGEWALLPPPAKDAEGHSFSCSVRNEKATGKCSLHLHSFTERSIKSATFGSPSAVGLMIGVGNVGEYLSVKDDEDTHTFITRDGGIHWNAVMKGAYLWEYGDSGSVIVIVKQSRPTNVIYYTLDEGDTWAEYEFSDIDMQIDAISTVPSDTSLNFLLWGADVGKGSNAAQIATVNIDFTGLKERQRPCKVNEEGGENEDYKMWEPKHPLQDNNCLFGHIAQYHRKRPEAQCVNGLNTDFQPKAGVSKNCKCTRQDFECDYNYERQSDGSCQLVPGYQPPDHLQMCKEDETLIEYNEPTGYRKIPLTTCEGGHELEKSTVHPCPGHEKEYEEKHAMSGVTLFFVILIPIAIAAAVGWYAVKKWKDGTLQGFGQIRLGESGAGGMRDSPLVTIPVTIIAGTWAVLSAMPLLVMSLWRSVKGYAPVGGSSGRRGGGGGSSGRGRPYTDRGAFSARRGEYSGVVEDEDELLVGSDDEEGMEV